MKLPFDILGCRNPERRQRPGWIAGLFAPSPSSRQQWSYIPRFEELEQRVVLSNLPGGSEFLINDDLTSHDASLQADVEIAVDASGNYVTVWEEPDANGIGIFARGFNANGTDKFTEIQVNSYTTGSQIDPDVAMSDDGNFFVVTWRGAGSGDTTGIYARRFDADGTDPTDNPGEFRVNTTTTGTQENPTVAMDDNGDLVVGWLNNSMGGDGKYVGFYFQRYDSTGASSGSEIEFNVVMHNNQAGANSGRIAVAMDSDGDFVLATSAWELKDIATDSHGGNNQDETNFVFFRRYEADGTEITTTGARSGQGHTGAGHSDGNFVVDQGVFQNEAHMPVDVAVEDDGVAGTLGNFVITWDYHDTGSNPTKDTADGTNDGVFARGFDSSGAENIAEFLVNTYTTGNQQEPDIAMDNDGNFVIVWSGEGTDDTDGVYFQVYDSTGTKHGVETLVNTTTTGAQQLPAVAMTNQGTSFGDFVIVWEGNGDEVDDADDDGVFGQRNIFNIAPVADTEAYTIDEDTTLSVAAAGVLVGDTDPDSGPSSLTAVLFGGVSNGSLTLNTDGSFTYEPDANFNGADSFTYRAYDGDRYSDVTAVTITIDPVNDAPVAVIDSASMGSDNTLNVTSSLGVLSNDTDVDIGDTIVVTADDVGAGTTANGSYTLNADGSYTYVPNSGFTGSDTFTYKANDGTLDSNEVTVTITITTNVAPVAVNDSTSDMLMNTSFIDVVGVLDNDTDDNGDAIVVTAADVTTTGTTDNGSYTLNADGSFTYTPNSGYTGADSFTYKANDGALDSGLATVTFNVVSNFPPVASNDSYFVLKDGSLTTGDPPIDFLGVLANDTDPNSNELSVATADVTSSGTTANGSYTLNSDGSFTYTPNSGFTGSDSFTYKAKDDGNPNMESGTATVTFTVGTNIVPIANDDGTDPTGTIGGLITGGNRKFVDDESGDTVGYEPEIVHVVDNMYAVVYRAGGNDGWIKTFTIDQDGSSITYDTGTPDNYLEYDGDGATPSIIAMPNGSLGGKQFAIAYDGPGADGWIKTIEIASDGSIAVRGTLEFVNGTAVDPDIIHVSGDIYAIVYAGVGSDGYLLTVDLNPDGTIDDSSSGESSTSIKATLEFDSVNTAAPDIIHVSGDIYAIAYQGEDSDGFLKTINLDGDNDDTYDNITISDVVDTLEFDITNAVEPDIVNVSGDIYAIAYGDTSGGKVITVDIDSAGNIADSVVGTLDFDTVDAHEPDIIGVSGDVYAIAYRDDANDGFLKTVDLDVKNDGSYDEIAVIDSFEYDTTHGYNPSIVQVSANVFAIAFRGDGNNNGYIQTVDIESGDDDLPYTVDEDGTLTIAADGVLTNDSDRDGDAIIAEKVTDPANGSVTLNSDGSFTYVPNADYNGTDTFTYRVADVLSEGPPRVLKQYGNTATVTITINPINDAPINNLNSNADFSLVTPATDKNTALTLSGTDLISITDVDDEGASDIKVTLTVTNGTIDIQTANSTITGDTTALVTLTGTVAQINADLDGMYFNPDNDFAGLASIQIFTEDMGNTGTGGDLTDTDTVYISVFGVVGAEFQVNTYTTFDQRRPVVVARDNGDFVVVWQDETQDPDNSRGVYFQRFNTTTTVSGETLTTVGVETRVNTYTTGSQGFPAAAMDSNGNFVVVWQSKGQEGTPASVTNAYSGSVTGASNDNPIEITSAGHNLTTGDSVTISDVGGNAAANGTFTVTVTGTGTFTLDGIDGTLTSHNAYTSGGTWTKNGAPIVITSAGHGLTTGNQVTITGVGGNTAANGTFDVTVIDTDTFSLDVSFGNGNYTSGGTWQLTSSMSYGIYAQRYNASGGPVESEFKVNTYTTDDQKNAAVAMDSGGNFVVVWEDETQDASGWGIYGQRYDSNGAVVGGEFSVNTYTTGSQRRPSVAMDSSGSDIGDFVVVWDGNGTEDSVGVFGRRYDWSTNDWKDTNEFLVNDDSTSHHANSQIFAFAAMDSGGNFVVSWSDNGQDGDSWGVYAQRFNASGTAQGSEFLVNTTTADGQFYSPVAMDSSGDFVITWSSYGQEESGTVTAVDETGPVVITSDGHNLTTGDTVTISGIVGTTEANDTWVVTVTDANNFSLNGLASGTAYVSGGTWKLLGYGVFAQRFSADGSTRGTEFEVNTENSSTQWIPGVAAMDSQGNFVVVWESMNQVSTTSDWDIYGQRYIGAFPASHSVLPGDAVYGTPDMGLAEAQANAPAAGNVVIASIDTGVDYTHPDLYLNIWLNEGEIPTAIKALLSDSDGDGRITFRDLNAAANASFVSDLNGNGYIDAGDLLSDSTWSNGADEDGNGFVDDLIGWDFIGNDNDPYDDNGHGTHGAGVVASIATRALIVPLKILDATGGGHDIEAVAAIDYTIDKKIPISMAGWTSTWVSSSLRYALQRAGIAGNIHITAAGNGNPLMLDVAGAMHFDNVVVVAASDGIDQVAPFSNTDPAGVDLFAPGVGIVSAASADSSGGEPIGGQLETASGEPLTVGAGYEIRHGTSVSIGFVTGAAALIWGERPDLDYRAVLDAIYVGAEPVPVLLGGSAHGRLNFLGALAQVVSLESRVESPESRAGGGLRVESREELRVESRESRAGSPVSRVQNFPSLDSGLSTLDSLDSRLSDRRLKTNGGAIELAIRSIVEEILDAKTADPNLFPSLNSGLSTLNSLRGVARDEVVRIITQGISNARATDEIVETVMERFPQLDAGEIRDLVEQARQVLDAESLNSVQPDDETVLDEVFSTWTEDELAMLGYNDWQDLSTPLDGPNADRLVAALESGEADRWLFAEEAGYQGSSDDVVAAVAGLLVASLPVTRRMAQLRTGRKNQCKMQNEKCKMRNN